MPIADYSYALAAATPAPPEGKEIIAFTHVSLELLLLGGFLVAALALPRAISLAGLNSSSAYLAQLGRRLRLTLGTVSLILIPATFLQLGWSSAKAAKSSLWEGFAPDALTKLFTAAPKKDEWLGAGGEAVIESALPLVLAGIGIWLLASGRKQPGNVKAAPRLLTAGAITGTVLLLTPALPSSFTDLTVQSVLGPVASQSHILSSAVWVGGLVFLTLLLLPHARNLDSALRADAAAFWPELWQRFSLLAMVSLAVIILSGGWLTWTHVGSLSQMVTTPYGQVLSVKILVVVVMVVFGAINHLHLIPAINRAKAHSRTDSVFALALGSCRRTVMLEAALGLAVVALVPFLSGSARKQAAAAAGKDAVDAAFGPAVFDGSILLMALGGLGVMILLFWGSAKASYRRSLA